MITRQGKTESQKNLEKKKTILNILLVIITIITIHSFLAFVQ